jgi:DegV family protein with EDD domain
MTVAIVTDSSVSLPNELLAGLPVFVVPMEIHHNGAVYRDGLDLSPASFYSLQRSSGAMPTTSAPHPGGFLEAFNAASQRADEIVCLTLSAELSATYAAADTARQMFRESNDKISIQVVDSRTAATAEGLMVLAAGRSARQGTPASTIIADIQRWRSSIALYGYLDSLYYVWKGGRVPRVVMWMGKLLDFKPILQLTDGKISMVERPRTERKAMDRIVALLRRGLGNAPVRVAVMHADAKSQAEVLADQLQTALAPEEIFITELTPVIGAHTGPGLVGCAIHRLEPTISA